MIPCYVLIMYMYILFMQRTVKMFLCYKNKTRLKIICRKSGKRTGKAARLRSFSLKFYYIFSAIWFPWRVHCLCVTYSNALRGPYHCSSVFCYDTAIIRLQVLAQVADDFDWWQSWCHNRRLTGKSSWDRLAPQCWVNYLGITWQHREVTTCKVEGRKSARIREIWWWWSS